MNCPSIRERIAFEVDFENGFWTPFPPRAWNMGSPLRLLQVDNLPWPCSVAVCELDLLQMMLLDLGTLLACFDFSHAGCMFVPCAPSANTKCVADAVTVRVVTLGVGYPSI